MPRILPATTQPPTLALPQALPQAKQHGRVIHTAHGALAADAHIGPLGVRVEIPGASPSHASSPALAQRMAAVALSTRAMTDLHDAKRRDAQQVDQGPDPEPTQVVIHSGTVAAAPIPDPRPTGGRGFLERYRGCCVLATSIVALTSAGLSAWEAVDADNAEAQRNWTYASAASGLIAITSLLAIWKGSR